MRMKADPRRSGPCVHRRPIVSPAKTCCFGPDGGPANTSTAKPERPAPPPAPRGARRQDRVSTCEGTGLARRRRTIPRLSSCNPCTTVLFGDLTGVCVRAQRHVPAVGGGLSSAGKPQGRAVNARPNVADAQWPVAKRPAGEQSGFDLRSGTLWTRGETLGGYGFDWRPSRELLPWRALMAGAGPRSHRFRNQRAGETAAVRLPLRMPIAGVNLPVADEQRMFGCSMQGSFDGYDSA